VLPTKLRDLQYAHDREPEVWKPIPDYEGLHEGLPWGRVKSLERIVNMSLVGPGLLKERISNKKNERLF
jgi:hypothetical protein